MARGVGGETSQRPESEGRIVRLIGNYGRTVRSSAVRLSEDTSDGMTLVAGYNAYLPRSSSFPTAFGAFWNSYFVKVCLGLLPQSRKCLIKAEHHVEH